MLCTKCSKSPALPNRKLCEPCTIKRRIYEQRYAAKYPEKLRLKTKTYYEKNPTYNTVHAQRYRQQWREQALTVYGGACVCCSETHLPYLEIDHVNGGGNQQRKVIRGTAWYKFLATNPRSDDVQLLCGNCHNVKTRRQSCSHPPLQPAQE
jgi:hypothetical protein